MSFDLVRVAARGNAEQCLEQLRSDTLGSFCLGEPLFLGEAAHAKESGEERANCEAT